MVVLTAAGHKLGKLWPQLAKHGDGICQMYPATARTVAHLVQHKQTTVVHLQLAHEAELYQSSWSAHHHDRFVCLQSLSLQSIADKASQSNDITNTAAAERLQLLQCSWLTVVIIHHHLCLVQTMVKALVITDVEQTSHY